MGYTENLLQNKRCFAEISLAALRHNIREIRSVLSGKTRLCAVIKANAYGHGAKQIAGACVEEGIEDFAVACLSEALELREAGIEGNILILGPTSPEYVKILIDRELTQTVSSSEEALAFAKEIQSYRSKNFAPSMPLPIHIKVDTGMSRHGFSTNTKEACQKSLADILRLKKMEELALNGIYTHFATASSEDRSFLRVQEDRFRNFVSELESKGISFLIHHTANTSATLKGEYFQHELVRIGLGLFGCLEGNLDKTSLQLKPVMTLKARISAIRLLEAGDGVSYNHSFIAPGKMKIGVIECGYGDGLLRSFSNKAIFSLKGRKVPQIGNICMDRCMIDLSAADEAKVGDYVVLFGGEGENFIDAESQAGRAGTISYELFSLLGSRVPRIYIDSN